MKIWPGWPQVLDCPHFTPAVQVSLRSNPAHLKDEYTATLNCSSFSTGISFSWGFPGGSEVKVSAWNAGDLGWIPGSDPWVGKIPGRRKWQPTPVVLPGESHGRRSLVGYSPRGRKESARLSDFTFTFFVTMCISCYSSLSPASISIHW